MITIIRFHKKQYTYLTLPLVLTVTKRFTGEKHALDAAKEAAKACVGSACEPFVTATQNSSITLASTGTPNTCIPAATNVAADLLNNSNQTSPAVSTTVLIQAEDPLTKFPIEPTGSLVQSPTAKEILDKIPLVIKTSTVQSKGFEKQHEAPSKLEEVRQAMRDGSWLNVENSSNKTFPQKDHPTSTTFDALRKVQPLSTNKDFPIDSSTTSLDSLDPLSQTPSVVLESTAPVPPTPPPMPTISSKNTTYSTVPITQETLEKAKSGLKSTHSVNISDNVVPPVAFRNHTPLVTLVEEIGSTPTSVEDHTPIVDKILREAADKKIIKYSDAPNNPQMGGSRPTQEGHIGYKKIYLDNEELRDNPLDISKIVLKAGMPKVSDETLIPRADQEHTNVIFAVQDDKYYIVGYFTSQKYATTKISNQQQSGDKKSADSDEDKPQYIFVFNQPREISSNDIEIDIEVTEYIQYSAISLNIIKAVENTLEYKPILYNPKGYITEDLQAILALQEIEKAEEALKKEKKMSSLTEDEKKKQEEKEMKKIAKAKENQAKQKKESQEKKAKAKADAESKQNSYHNE